MPVARRSPARPSRRTSRSTASSSVTTYQYITGGAGNDTLFGSGTAYTTIAGGLGNDSIDCGGGDGAVDYTGSATAVVVDLTAATGTGEGFDSIVNCDDINGSDHGDTLTGNGDCQLDRRR